MTDDYDIGHGKPPTVTRFQKGQSGNPKGRPKGTRNLKTDLEAELGQRIHIKENNLPLNVSKQRALVKTLTAKSLNGDTRSASLLLSMVWRLIDKDPPTESTRDLAAEDQAILDDYLRRQLPPTDKETDHE